MTHVPSTNTGQVQRPPRLRRFDLALLVGLCLAMLAYGVGNLSLRPALTDGQQHLAAGVRLAQEGQYTLRSDWVGWHGREPFVPLLIAAMDLARRALGSEPVSLDCFDGKKASSECPSQYAPYKALNIVLLVLAAAGTFFLALRLTESRWLAYAAFLLTTQSEFLLLSTDRFYTEVPAASLMVATSTFALLALTERRVVYSALLGLALATLVLIKVVFAYLWILLVLAIVVSDWLQGQRRSSTASLVGVFLVFHFVPVGAWMTRNYVMSGDFSIVEGRRASVFSLRATYNEMRDDEFVAGFTYYWPPAGRNLARFGIPRESYERFEVRNEGGFRRTSGEVIRRSRQVLRSEAPLDGEPLDRRRAEARLERWMREQMLADPWQHLKVSLLLAWRGVFPDIWPRKVERCGLGYIPFNVSDDNVVRFDNTPSHPRLAGSWGFDNWPRWGIRFGAVSAGILGLSGFLAIIIAPLFCFLLRRKGVEMAVVVLPAFYSHAVYAAVSHFHPRYAVPEIPLRILATMVLLFLLASLVRRLVRNTRSGAAT